jgi:DNA-directed RNA polymerase subunit RPC12/RpoP
MEKHNVNVTQSRAKTFLPCFLCGNNLEMRFSKNRKPYFVCFDCGIQLFVRGKSGIRKLEELLANISETNIPFHRSTENFLQFQSLLTDLADLRRQIKKLDGEITFLFPDNELVRARDALQKRVNGVLAQLDELAEGEGK